MLAELDGAALKSLYGGRPTRFWKLQALGNHFVIACHQAASDYPALARQLCRPSTSVGADGLLTIDLAASPPLVRMWNPDGSEDFCANGLCCAAYLCAVLGWGRLDRLQAPGREVSVSLCGRPRGADVVLGLGQPSYEPTLIPARLTAPVDPRQGVPLQLLDRRLTVVPISTGTTHCVVFGDELPDDAAFLRDSPAIENHSDFPDRTSVLWCAMRRSGLALRVWERGVGETLACGTGAAAAAAVAVDSGRASSPVSVTTRGGTCRVAYEPQQGLFLITHVELAFEGLAPSPTTEAKAEAEAEPGEMAVAEALAD